MPSLRVVMVARSKLFSGAPVSTNASKGLGVCDGVAGCHRDELSSESFKETTGLFRMVIVCFLIWDSVYTATLA